MSQPNIEQSTSRREARAEIARRIERHRHSNRATPCIMAVCRTTGIAYAITSPGLDAASATLLLEHSSPFASQTAVHKLCKHAKLSAMNSEILAGLALSMATHHRLVALQDMEALEANAALQAVDHEVLCALVRTLYAYATKGAYSIPAMRAMPECAASINYCVKEWIKDIAACLPSAAQQELARIAGAGNVSITILSKTERNAVALAKASNRLAKYEVAFEASDTLLTAQEEFKAARKEAKEIWSKIIAANVPTSKALRDVMRDLLTDQNLNACNPALRAKIVTACTHLQHPQAQALARIIKDTCNPYDLFAKGELDLEDSGLIAGTEVEAYKGMSLRDRLAAIKAARISKEPDADAIAEGEGQAGDSATDSNDQQAIDSNQQANDSDSAANSMDDF